jgi:hypothetical protein
MIVRSELRDKVEELATRIWDRSAIDAWFKKLAAEGIRKKSTFIEQTVKNKQSILDRIQRKGEECEFLSHN